MTYRQKFAVSAALIIVLAVAQLGLSLLLLANQQRLSDAQDVQLESLLLSDELRSSSDELTRTARTYVVTGDRSFQDEYWLILDVRNGEAPRPDGRQVSLRQLMEDIGFTGEELAKLTEAENNSNALVATEVAAFEAMEGRFTEVVGGTSTDLGDYTRTGPMDQEFAVEIMFDQQYHADKAIILDPILEAEQMVEERTLNEVTKYDDRSRLLIWLSTIAGLALVALVVAVYVLVERPVLKSMRTVQTELNDLTSGASDLSTRLSARGDDEIDQLATAFNLLMDRLDALVHQIAESGRKVTAATARIADGASGLETTVAEQLSATKEVSAGAQTIGATSEDLTRRMSGVSSRSDEAARTAAKSREGLETMSTGMAEIADASELITARLTTISEKAQNITNVVGTIKRVAEQTNLLSLNAAIEAEKAGQYGQGFSVVAREIRRLADQTALATIDIDRTVEEMTEAVDSGVSTIDLFSQRVQNSADSVADVSVNMARITEQVAALAPDFETVLHGMEEQSDGAKQISGTMAGLSDTTGRTALAIDESRAAIAELNQAAAELQAEVESLRGSI